MRPRALFLAISLWIAPTAFAGSGVELPPGEDPDVWAPAFEFAGLAPDTGEVRPHIHIEDNGAHWVLRAYDGQGATRSAEVRTPKTEAEREQVALVASGLMRAMSVPVSAAPTPEPDPPETNEDPFFDDFEIEPVVEAMEVTTAPVRKRGKKDGRKRTTMAPLDFGGGIATRPQTGAGGLVTIGTRLAWKDNWSAHLDLSIITRHEAYLNGARPEYSGFDTDFTAYYRLGKIYSFGPMVGLAYRNFQQDFIRLGEVAVPKVGGASSLRLVGGRWWAFRLVTKASVDLANIELLAANGRSGSLSRFGVQNSLVFTIGNKVDPFIEKKTSRR